MRLLALVLTAAVAAAGVATEATAAKRHGKHAQSGAKCKRHHHRKHCRKPRKPAHHVTAPAPVAHTTTITESTGVWVTPPPVNDPAAPPPLGHLQVVAREFTLTASRATLATGRVAIELDNLGQDPHDLRVERVDAPGTGFDFELTKPGALTSRKVELGAGSWKLYCTLPGHDAAGMHALITVD